MRSIYGEYVTKKNTPKKQEQDIYKAYEILLRNLTRIREYCERENQDWPIIVSGVEGSGKSTLAIQIAQHLDPGFTLQDNLIYGFADGPQSMRAFWDRFKTVPFKAPVYDEAVTFLFSQKHTSKEAKECQVLFKLKRECLHFDVMVVQSYWDMVLDIRERRAKSMIYTYVDAINIPGQPAPKFIHKFAYYSGQKMIELSMSNKARKAFKSPGQLFKIIRPEFFGEFPDMPVDLQKAYKELKWQNMTNYADGVFGTAGKTGHIGIEKTLDFDRFEDKYCKG